MKIMSNSIKSYGVLISILIGIVVFVVSTGIINSNIVPPNNNILIYLSDHTNYIDGKNGGEDTIFIKSDKEYKNYLDALYKDSIFDLTNIKTVEFKKLNQFRKSRSNSTKIHLIRDLKDNNLKEDPSGKSTVYYFKKPKLLYNQIYFSKDSSKINITIDSLDSVYFQQYQGISQEKSFFYNHNPKFLLWIILISIAIGISFCLIPLFISEIKKYSKNLKVWEIISNFLSASLIISCLFIPLIISNSPSDSLIVKPLDMVSYFKTGITPKGLYYNSIMPFAGAFFWLVLVFSMNIQASKLYNDKTEKALKMFSLIQKDFEKYLIIISLLLAYTIFCTNTQVDALNSLIGAKSSFKLFPTEFSFINGLMQSFFLILIYFIVSSSFNAIKESILQETTIAPDVVAIYDVDERKKALDYLKLALTLLAPILGGGIQEIIKIIFE